MDMEEISGGKENAQTLGDMDVSKQSPFDTSMTRSRMLRCARAFNLSLVS